MQTWNGGNSGRREGSPWTELTNVPPEMLSVSVTDMGGELANQSWCWILRSEIREEGCGVETFQWTHTEIIQKDGVSKR